MSAPGGAGRYNHRVQTWLNQHSFLVAAAAALILLAVLLFRDGVRPPDLVALGALLLGLAAAHVFLAPGRAAESESVRQEIGRGTPVLLEFQSPY